MAFFVTLKCFFGFFYLDVCFLMFERYFYAAMLFYVQTTVVCVIKNGRVAKKTH